MYMCVFRRAQQIFSQQLVDQNSVNKLNMFSKFMLCGHHWSYLALGSWYLVLGGQYNHGPLPIGHVRLRQDV